MEIKFRDYDLEKKEMRYFDIDGYDREYHNCYGNIMQFTGLLDKNGKEIYAGDILASNLNGTGKETDVWYISIDWNEKVGAYCIHDSKYWKRGSVKESHLADIFTSWQHIYDFEIVGNVYQNKDVLDNN